MEVPPLMAALYSDQVDLIREYLDGLSEIQRMAYHIAVDHLGTSFNLVRSNGYQDWLKEREKKSNGESGK